MQQQEFKEYLEYKEESEDFEEFLKNKYERQQSEDNGSGRDTSTSEE
jgi:cephalosporin-C deacetylase-like acetyl esterase